MRDCREYVNIVNVGKNRMQKPVALYCDIHAIHDIHVFTKKQKQSEEPTCSI